MALFPTMVALADIKIPENHSLDGVDISAALFNSVRLPERMLFWKYRKQGAVRHGKWKLMIDNDQKMLFDLEKDVGEQQDVADSHIETVDELSDAFDKWYKDVTSHQPQRTI